MKTHWTTVIAILALCLPSLAGGGETYDTELASIDALSLKVVILDGIPDTSRTKNVEMIEAEVVASATRLLKEAGIQVSDLAPVAMYIFGDCDGPSETGQEAALMMSLEISESATLARRLGWQDAEPFPAITWLEQEVQLFRVASIREALIERAESLVSEFVRKHRQAREFLASANAQR
jgi:hypothetical protein